MMRTLRGRRALGPRPPSRLVEALARISDHFGGRLITIVSGYRPAGGNTRATSHHIDGHALDIRVRGVPNTELRDYVRATFNHVGVGFYPRSHFVHFDVRDHDSYWVDWSRPGQAPRYQHRGDPAPSDADPAVVETTGMGGGAPEPAPSEDSSEAAEPGGTDSP